MKQTKRAVLLGAHPWNDTPLGLHHIARALSRLNWDVAYIEPPFSVLHVLMRTTRGRVVSPSFRSSGEARISLLSPYVAVPHLNAPVLRSAATISLTTRLSWPSVPRAISETTFDQPDLVINGDARLWNWARDIGARKTCYRLADNSALFSVATQAMREREIRELPQYDTIIATSEPLVDMARRAGAEDVYLLSNGVDFKQFSTSVAAPSLITNIPRPRIMYVGAVDAWFDWRTVCQAADKRPEYHFIVIGPVSSPCPAQLPRNIHLLGKKDYRDMPAFLQAGDVGIVPFFLQGQEEAVSAINPIKLYEYLASGLPVVSTLLPSGMEAGDELIHVSDSVAFLNGLDAAVKRGRVSINDRSRARDWTVLTGKMLSALQLDS